MSAGEAMSAAEPMSAGEPMPAGKIVLIIFGIILGIILFGLIVWGCVYLCRRWEIHYNIAVPANAKATHDENLNSENIIDNSPSSVFAETGNIQKRDPTNVIRDLTGVRIQDSNSKRITDSYHSRNNGAISGIKYTGIDRNDHSSMNRDIITNITGTNNNYSISRISTSLSSHAIPNQNRNSTKNSVSIDVNSCKSKNNGT